MASSVWKVMITRNRWVAAAVVVLAAAVTVATLALAGGDGSPDGDGATPLRRTRTEPEIPQARWRVRAFAAGTQGPAGPKVRKAVNHQRDALARAITTVSDAVLLAPESLADLAGGPLSRPAAKALARSDLALPKRISKVETTRRRAEIGVDARGADRAAARVVIRMKAEVEGRHVRLLQRTNLYLAKRGDRWQVIAFDGTRKRLR